MEKNSDKQLSIVLLEFINNIIAKGKTHRKENSEKRDSKTTGRIFFLFE